MAVDVLTTVFKAKDSISPAFDRMSAKASAFTTKTSANFARLGRVFDRTTKELNQLNSSFSRLDGMVGVGAGLSVGYAAAVGADAFLSLDKNISAAAAKFSIFDRNSEAFTELRNKALEMGATTEFTAGQSAEALKNLGTAGFTASQAIEGLNTVLDLATSTQTEIAISADVAAKSMSAFGLKSEDPVKMAKNLSVTSDVLNKLITTSGFGQLEEFLDVLSMSGSTARAAGVDIQTWGAIVASSVSEAVPASTAGTRFANVLSFMLKNTSKFNKEGIKLKDDVTGNFRDIIDIFADVENMTKSMGKFESQALLGDLFGERGGKMMTSILENGVDKLREYQKEVKGATGLTAKMASFMRQGLSGGVDAMKSGFEAIAIAIGDAFQPEIDSAIKNLTEFARNSKEWFIQNKETIKSVVMITAKLIPFVLGLKVLIGVMTAVNTVMMMNPASLLIGSIIALSAVIYMLTTDFNETKKAGDSLFDSLNQFKVLIAPIEMIWDSLKGGVAVFKAFTQGGFTEGIKELGKYILSYILYPLELVENMLTRFNVFGKKFDFIKGIRDDLNNFTEQETFTGSASGLGGTSSGMGLINLDKYRTEAITESIQSQQYNIGITTPDGAGVETESPLPSNIILKQISTSTGV